MYCAVCKCEFDGWTDTCPTCMTPLVMAKPPELSASVQTSLTYEDLLALVKENEGLLTIDLTAAEVGMQKQRAFPYLGYGFAWAKRMQGAFEENPANLIATEIGTDKKRSFPYFGFGFSWVKKLEGQLSGNHVTLTASQVKREAKQNFLYLGYGYAWTCEMAGKCGDQLNADFVITDIGRKKERGFPYFGFGFAWENKGTLTISIVE